MSVWLALLRRGDASAAEGLWSAYFTRMGGLAQRLLRGRARGTNDPEDAAASAFVSFYRGMKAGAFGQLSGRTDLWRLLAAMTANKCVDRMRREGRVKRGGKFGVDPGSVLSGVAAASEGPGGRAELADLREWLLARLREEDGCLRTIVEWRMEGETIDRIAQRLGCARRTVERKLHLIQSICESEME